MKANDQFILRNIAGEHLLIPVGETAVSIKGMLILSESGVLIYEKLIGGCSKEELIEMLMKEYDVAEEEATRDTDAFLDKMRQLNMIVED